MNVFLYSSDYIVIKTNKIYSSINLESDNIISKAPEQPLHFPFCCFKYNFYIDRQQSKQSTLPKGYFLLMKSSQTKRNGYIIVQGVQNVFQQI